MLKEVFGIDNTQISKAKSERVDKQYYVDFAVNKKEAEDAIKIAEIFITELGNFLALLNENKINGLHEKAAELFIE